MNPAVPLLLVLSILPLVLARKRAELPVAWCVAGLAAMLLLWPALVDADGVPSPAASAGAVAPWVGLLDPAGGNPTLSDVTFQIQPWLLHLRAELRAGRPPFWNPYQFSGAPFWSNGQSAPLFPLHLLFAALPLQLGLVLLPWLRVTIAGVGAWALARELDVAPRAALVAAIAFPLSGMLSSFLLYPMANALCLVPWVLRETELLARRRGGWWRLGTVVGLQALGGHPETVAHTAMLAALYLAVRSVGGERAAGAGATRRWRAWIGLAAALVTGALVAGVQLLPLAWNVAGSSRWQEWAAGARPPLATMLDVALRLVLPDLFGHPAAGTWWGPFNYNATAVFAGTLALPLAVVGLVDRARDPRLRAVAATTIAAALAAYQVSPVRELLLLLPVVDRMLHHRLLFAVDLGLALLAAAGLDALARGRSRGLAAGTAAVVAGLAAAWVRHHDAWRAAGELAHQGRWTAWAAVALCGLSLAAVAARRQERRAASVGGARREDRAPGLLAPAARAPITSAVIATIAVVVFLGELVVAHARTNPGLALGSLFPRTPAIAFLAEREGRLAALDAALRPNTAIVHRLRDVRGDDTLKLARYERVYRSFAGASPYFFEPIVDWHHPWLDRLGVRWVLAAPGAASPAPEWSVAYEGADARIFERPRALALVRWSDGGTAGLEVEESEPGRWAIAFSTSEPRTLVVAETWDPGWRGSVVGAAATAGGSKATLAPADETLIGARIGPGSGTLRLRYRPRGLGTGALASALGVALVAVAALRHRPAEEAPR